MYKQFDNLSELIEFLRVRKEITKLEAARLSKIGTDIAFAELDQAFDINVQDDEYFLGLSGISN